MIEKELHAALSTLGVSVTPVKMKQDSRLPAITYQVVFDGDDQCLSGVITGRTVRMQVDVWAKTYGEAKTLKQQAVEQIVLLQGAEISAMDLYEEHTEIFRQLINFKYRS